MFVEIRRETDAELANRIANDADVLPFISPSAAPVDVTPAIDTCVVLTNGEDAMQIYEQKAPRVWEVMTVFRKTCRGKRALETGHAMLDYMTPYADVIFGCIPDKLPHARWFYRHFGGREVEQVETKLGTFIANPGTKLYELRVN